MPRTRLLEFLLTRSGDWFKLRAICKACMLRLCWWAAGFVVDPQFPHSKMPDAEKVRATIRNFAHAQPIAQQVIDASASSIDPLFVTVIEDRPLMRWILEDGSRDFYCCTQKTGRPTRFICCNAHAHDLLLTHRELLRHSMCRQCLKAFWQWANGGNVDWWSGARSINSTARIAQSSVCLRPTCPCYILVILPNVPFCSLDKTKSCDASVQLLRSHGGVPKPRQYVKASFSDETSRFRFRSKFT